MIFKNKIVLITGAASGIGAATSLKFSEEGASVVLVDKNLQNLKGIEQRCKDALLIHADMTIDSDVKRILKETIEKYKKLDILVNCAGIIRLGSIIDGSNFQTYDEIMNINIRSNVHLTNLAAPYLIQTKGNIVNVSSCVTEMPYMPPLSSIYNISKAAVSVFTKTTAVELGAHGVRVNAVSPGPTNTNLSTNCELDFPQIDIRTATLLNRVSEPQEVADFILYLTSDKAKGITGSIFYLDNGFSLKGALSY